MKTPIIGHSQKAQMIVLVEPSFGIQCVPVSRAASGAWGHAKTEERRRLGTARGTVMRLRVRTDWRKNWGTEGWRGLFFWCLPSDDRSNWFERFTEQGRIWRLEWLYRSLGQRERERREREHVVVWKAWQFFSVFSAFSDPYLTGVRYKGTNHMQVTRIQMKSCHRSGA